MARRRAVYWTCQIAGWSGAVSLNTLFSTLREEPGPPLWKTAVAYAVNSVIAIGCTHGFRAVIRRGGWLSWGLTRVLWRVLIGIIVTAVAITLISIPAWLAILQRDAWPLTEWVPWAVMGWTWWVGAWTLMYVGVQYFERWRQAEVDKLQLVIEAQQAQLQGLMVQLQPHFLFNCLNSVRALIVEDPAKARATVTALSQLLRHSLQVGKASTVPLTTEIEMVRIYLELEAVRFDERLRTDFDIAGDTGGLHVPAMLVQSLVENGVKHGIERSLTGGTIRVASWREPGALRVRVTNPGRIRPGDDSTRIGLANSRARLQLLYGHDASLALRDDGRTVTAEVSIPIPEIAA
jgi:two-component system LytT family sensor kinase